MSSVMLVVAGIVYVSAVIVVSRKAAVWLRRYLPFVREDLVYAGALISTSLNYVEWAREGGLAGDVAMEQAGAALFGSLAFAGLRWPGLLSAGWLLHAAWDWVLHPMPATAWVPSWFPDLCVGFDVALAAYIAGRARGLMPVALSRTRNASVIGLLMMAVSLVAPERAFAQVATGHEHHVAAAKAAPQHAGHEPSPSKPSPFLAAILHHAGSGTSVEPPASPIPMLMGQAGSWMWMVHGTVFVAAVEQNSAGSRDQVLSTNWLMPMVGRKIGRGLFTARTMISFEPATSRYIGNPEPYQPAHDFFMEIAATYDLPLTKHLLLSFYGAPVGEPALGPSAFMHRLSSSENPLVPVSHDTQDSTHQSRDVLTAGLAYRNVRVEASGFHGRGPDRDRWAVEQGAIDSWSARVTASPSLNWAFQVSGGRLVSPMRSMPEVDLDRVTASLSYTRPMAKGYWATTVSWGRDEHVGAPDQVRNSYLAEATIRGLGANSLWARIEAADRMLAASTGGRVVHGTARVDAITAGYAREIRLAPHLETALGAQFTIYRPSGIAGAVYGQRPAAAVVFFRVRPNGQH